MKVILALIFFSLLSHSAVAAKCGTPIYIWKDISKMSKYKSILYYHKPDPAVKNRHIAIIIAPGGSYHHLGLYNEGYKSAAFFNKNGITSFVLRYRTAQSGYHYPAMLEDIQRAIQIVKERSGEFDIQEDKVGIIGYSAGGHLVLMAGTLYDSHNTLKDLGLPVKVSLKPSFIIPVYPVVSMQDTISHKWSRKSLLGTKLTQKVKDEFSMENQITPSTSPTYVVVAQDDLVVNPENSYLLYRKLQEKGVPSHLEIYANGGHGFGMLNNRFWKTYKWNEKLLKWLLEEGLI